MKITVKNSAGKSFVVVVSGNSAVIGRSTKCNVIVPDEALSRQHCRIEMDLDTFYVTDLASANGVFIDGRRIDANVKTPFSSFNQLSLGILECTVEDFELVNPATLAPKARRQRPDFSIPDSPTKKISNEELLDYKTKKKKQKSMELFLLIIIPAVIIGGAIYFNNAENSETEIVEQSMSVVETPPPSVEAAPNKFLAAQYKELASRNDCSEFKTKCASLGLNASKFEKLVQNRNEYFIYMNPIIRSGDPRFKNVINHEKGSDLIGFHTLIHSRFFDDYLFGKLTQVHLIINSPEGNPLKVYRLHPETLKPESIKRTKLMTSIGNALNEGNPDLFFEEINSQIPSMEF